MKKRSGYQPKTGAKCSCRPGIQRDNCPSCEGTGWVIDFKLIRTLNGVISSNERILKDIE
jgi:hypothetical protein